LRKLVTAVLAAGIAVVPFAVPASSAETGPGSLGRFTTPFREDGAAYDPATNTFGGTRGDTGCLEADANGHKDCLPAGASQNVLANGRILYWNAIEGAEDLDQPDEAVIPKGGDLARNDSSRVLTLDWNTQKGKRWDTPPNATGYHQVPGEPPLIPDTDNSNSNANRNSDGSLFCSDQKQLSNGTVLAAGGTNYYAEPRLDPSTGVIELEGVKNARIFDPSIGTAGDWRPTGSLNYGRWYPSMVTLASGDLFIASGVTKLIKPIYPDKDPSRSGDNVPETETYHANPADPLYRTWTDNEANRSLPLFPRLHLLPNGNVYYDAAGQAYNPQGQSYAQALWNVAATYNPTTNAWSDLGIPGLDNPVTADGNVAEPGFRGSTFSQALPFKPNGDKAYTSASYLTAGGVQLMSPGSYFPTSSSRISTVDVSGGEEALSTTPTGPLGRARWYSSAVTLPTGQVFAFSGADVDEVVSPGHESPIRQAEMFTPTYEDGKYVGGTWADVAVAQRRRTYHNNAVLLPDGRILVGGHAPIPNTYYKVQNDPDNSVRPPSNNFKDASFEIFEPPYLHWGVSRPVIGTVNQAVKTGTTLVVPTTDAAKIKSVVLVRNPAETHLIDADQRVVELPFTQVGSTVHATVTGNKAVLPPGPYMLFVNKDAGDGKLVPSVAKQVFVDAAVPSWAKAAATYPKAAAATPAAPKTGAASQAPKQAAAVKAGTARAQVTQGGTATELSTQSVAANRAVDRPRQAGMLGLLIGGALLAAGALAGTSRRRLALRTATAAVRIEE
jgi:hypothetical protein